MNTAFRCLLLLATVLLSATAEAQSRFVVSYVVGNSHVSNVSAYKDSSRSGISIAYRINTHLSALAGYTEYAGFFVNSGASIKLEVINRTLELAYRWNPTQHIRPFARAGVGFWKASSYGYGSLLGSDEGTGTTYAVGLDADLGDLFVLTATYDRQKDVSGANLDTLSLGLGYRF